MKDVAIPIDKLLERYKITLADLQQRIFLLELHIEELENPKDEVGPESNPI